MSAGLTHFNIVLFLSISMSQVVFDSALWPLDMVHSLVCVSVCECEWASGWRIEDIQHKRQRFLGLEILLFCCSGWFFYWLHTLFWLFLCCHVCVSVCSVCSVSPPAAEEPSARVSVPGTTCWPWGNDRGNWTADSVICVCTDFLMSVCMCVFMCVCVSSQASMHSSHSQPFRWNRIETQNNRVELSLG